MQVTASRCSIYLQSPWMQKFWNSASHGFFFFLFLLFFPLLPPFFFLLGLSEVFSLSVLFLLGLTTCSTKKKKNERFIDKHLSSSWIPFWRYEINPRIESSWRWVSYLCYYLAQFIQQNWTKRMFVSHGT